MHEDIHVEVLSWHGEPGLVVDPGTRLWGDGM